MGDLRDPRLMYPGYRFAGLFDFAVYLVKRKR